ncbi:hypothetical protein JXR93_04375 [bacterium]|nr:hypothetical protein [bacterium]
MKNKLPILYSLLIILLSGCFGSSYRQSLPISKDPDFAIEAGGGFSIYKDSITDEKEFAPLMNLSFYKNLLKADNISFGILTLFTGVGVEFKIETIKSDIVNINIVNDFFVGLAGIDGIVFGNQMILTTRLSFGDFAIFGGAGFFVGAGTIETSNNGEPLAFLKIQGGLSVDFDESALVLETNYQTKSALSMGFLVNLGMLFFF